MVDLPFWRGLSRQIEDLPGHYLGRPTGLERVYVPNEGVVAVPRPHARRASFLNRNPHAYALPGRRDSSAQPGSSRIGTAPARYNSESCLQQHEQGATPRAPPTPPSCTHTPSPQRHHTPRKVLTVLQPPPSLWQEISWQETASECRTSRPTLTTLLPTRHAAPPPPLHARNPHPIADPGGDASHHFPPAPTSRSSIAPPLPKPNSAALGFAKLTCLLGCAVQSVNFGAGDGRARLVRSKD